MISSKLVVFSINAGILSAWFLQYLLSLQNAQIPAHLTHHTAFAAEELIPISIASELMKLVKEISDYPTNVDQTKAAGFKPVLEHIGEAQPINPDGSCTHHFLFPNHDHTLCILPQRVDIGKHYIFTGGLDGTKEKFQDLVDRVSSFGKYNFIQDIDSYPPVKELFESEKFQEAAKSICPANATYLDPFQFNFIMQVPGQTVAVHLDAPYFFGTSRFRVPQWLLVCMVFSNLFSDKFVNQVQVVGYLHEWQPKEDRSVGGEFVYFSESGKMSVVSPASRAGTLVDGSKVLHAAKVFQPNVKAPHLSKDSYSSLRYVGNDSWIVQSDEKVIQRYHTNDLRIAIVYRARCFKDQEEAERFYNQGEEDMMSLDYILDRFFDDLDRRGIYSLDNLRKMDRLQLSFLLMDTYIKYPLPPKELTSIPVNYCAASELMPWLNPLLNHFC